MRWLRRREQQLLARERANRASRAKLEATVRSRLFAQVEAVDAEVEAYRLGRRRPPRGTTS